MFWFNMNPGKEKAGTPYVAPYKLKWFSDVRWRKAMAHAVDRDGIAKTAFAGLAEKERRHESRFKQIAEGLEAASKSASINYPDEYVDYLYVLISEGGRAGDRVELDAESTDMAMIEAAMSFEREQLALQRDVGSLLGEEHRKIIDQIVHEEMAHLVELAELKKELST